mmetsp:Transcript_39434/g.84447  ORF Transcript_39434/g.84447 Transcript_39434/m.84447 type:complete len:545 (-) Transcript_39434:1157-2791(-)
MEVHSAPREPTDEGVHLVRVLDVKRRVLQELLHDLEVALNVAARLKTQPLEHHEGLVRPLCVEGLEGVLPVLARVSTDGTEGCHLVSHVGSLLERGVQQGLDLGVRVSKLSKVGKSTVPDGPSGLALSVRLVSPLDVVGVVDLQELVLQSGCQALENKVAHLVDVNRVGLWDLVRELFRRWQLHGVGPELLVKGVISENLAESLGDTVIHLQLLSTLVGLQKIEDEVGDQPLTGFPLVELIRVVGEEELQLLATLLHLQLHGGRKVSQHTRGWLDRNVLEGEALAHLCHLQDVGCGVANAGLASGAVLDGGKNQVLAIRANKTDLDWDKLRLLLLRHVWGDRELLRAVQSESLVALVVLRGHLQSWSTCLGVPELETSERGVVSVLHSLVKVIGSHGLTIVPLKVQIDSLLETLLSKQRVVHPDDLRTLVVDGKGVEVVNLHVRRRPDGVGHGAGILCKLPGSDNHDIVDALDGRRVHERGELLVSEHGEALLERELEPIAAGHPVSGPVVEVLVADHALDSVVVHVRRRLRGAQHQPRVEDVQ